MGFFFINSCIVVVSFVLWILILNIVNDEVLKVFCESLTTLYERKITDKLYSLVREIITFYITFRKVILLYTTYI